jgi:hypothetical protein
VRRRQSQLVSDLAESRTRLLDQAIDLYHQCIPLFPDTDKRSRARAVAVAELARTQFWQGDTPGAVANLAAALELFTEINSPEAEVVRRWQGEMALAADPAMPPRAHRIVDTSGVEAQ